MSESKRKAILVGKNASYASLAGMIADAIATIFSPAYSGFFSAVAKLLTGG